MPGFVETGCKAFMAGGAVGLYLRVKLTSGKLAVAGLTDKEIGTIEAEAFADGDMRAVRLTSAQGTCKMVAKGALTIGDPVYTLADGKVGDSSSTAFLVGTALTAATADGDIVEVLRNSHGDTAVS